MMLLKDAGRTAAFGVRLPDAPAGIRGKRLLVVCKQGWRGGNDFPSNDSRAPTGVEAGVVSFIRKLGIAPDYRRAGAAAVG